MSVLLWGGGREEYRGDGVREMREMETLSQVEDLGGTKCIRERADRPSYKLYIFAGKVLRNI